MLWLIKTPAHQHPSNGGKPHREWTKGNRSLRAIPAEGPISIRQELILTGHSNRSSQGEEELMWLPYWWLLLLSFRSFPTQRMGLGISVDQIGLSLTCVLLHWCASWRIHQETEGEKETDSKCVFAFSMHIFCVFIHIHCLICCYMFSSCIYYFLKWLYNVGWSQKMKATAFY